MSEYSDVMNIGELDRLYTDAETADKALFAEQRSNILLVAGEHYSRRGLTNFESGRNSSDVNKTNQIRLTKNHTKKAHRRITKAIRENANGVRFSARRDGEMSDQKTAEMNQAVWEYTKDICKMQEKTRRWASDFATVGEVFVKIFWDEHLGELKGYNAKLTPDGIDEVDAQGNLVQDDSKPIFTGQLRYERVFGFNLLRCPYAKEIEESPYLIVRKMIETKLLKKKYAHDKEILKAIADSENEEFIIFDTNTTGYSRAKNQSSIREYYFRKSPVYPNGYYYITTKGTILEKGELPLGVFPIIGKAYDENQTSPRGSSFIKQSRPYQAEINRASSSQVMHQITIGDDKVLYQAGTKLAPGALLPGVRGITYQGSPPTILAGRDGSQYQGYVDAQVSEFYDILDINALFEPKTEMKGGNDMFALLFRSAVQRQQLSEYSEKFEEFLAEIAITTVTLLKEYLPDDVLIPAIGKKEVVNIAEFRNTDPLSYRVKVVPQDDTLETQFGKQIVFQNLMQYSSGQLTKQDIGMLMRSMPYANTEEQFNEYTLDYDSAKNMMLALDRGEYPESIDEDNHEYIVTKLSNRMRQADFQYLPDQVKQNYLQKRQDHQGFSEEQRKRLLAEQAKYIPTDGALIACDLYVADKKDPDKAPKRARIPQKALDWLMETLEKQSGTVTSFDGATLGDLKDMETVGGQTQMPEQDDPMGLGDGMPPEGMPPEGMPPEGMGMPANPWEQMN